MKAILIAAFALMASPAALASEIRVTFAPDFQKKLETEYGTREGEVLAKRVERDLKRALEREGASVARIDVVIRDAKPSRPTFQQGADTPGLDIFRSVSTGGMSLSAQAFDADGTPAGSLDYEWYEWDIRNAGITTWQDAGRASDRFARKFAKALD